MHDKQVRAVRRFHSYCVGTGKTGTHSISGLLERNYRSAHEPESELLISAVFDAVEGRTSADEVRAFLRARDDRLFLEMESDGTLYCFLDLLLDEFPGARILLTIRDCYSWMDSVFNHNLSRPPGGLWRKYDDFTFAPWEFRHTEHERVLAEHGLLTLGHYLSHWSRHNQTVIDSTPKERLLVVRTDRIRESAPQIADFFGIMEQTLDISKAHMFRNPQHFKLLSQIDTEFLNAAVHQYCQPLMQKYFPDITGLQSVRVNT